MKDKYKYSTSQLFNFAKDSYLERTSRPIYAMVFLLPFIIFYEVGTFCINTDILNQSQIRVVAFVWLQNLLESLGFGGKFAWVAPPLAVIVILTALQITSSKQWRFWIGDILPMTAECVLLAVPLIVLTLFLSSSAGPDGNISWFDDSAIQAQAESLPVCSSVAGGSLSPLSAEAGEVGPGQSLLANIVTGIGAGIYEELVFRLILICLLMLLFQDVLRLTHIKAIVLSVLISAALFSAHHHVIFVDGQLGQTAAFNWTEFSFRTIAGIYFAILFAIRGFGVTAGTHAFYDIIATIINVVFFQQ
ncbi:MAG TPA: CPBP family intramembrane glutamic endopeptidase [Sedimentisphaerales bacterium]|nr:CPBP family intramembrane glutamic endopeptidase [Sedimentisphaerales bacterium]